MSAPTEKTVRQKLVEKVLARFRGITPGAGFNFDLSTKIFEWRDSDYDLAELPAGNLMDKTDTVTEGPTTRTHSHKVAFELVFTTAKKESTTATLTAADVRKLIADVNQAIGIDEKWDELAFMTSAVADEMDVIQGEKIIAQVKLSFSISFRTLRFNAYDQG